MSNPISRWQFWRFPFKDAAKEPASEKEKQIQRPVYIRPPGAIADDALFLETCVRCAACAAACPHDVIEEVGPAGGRAEGTPVLKPQENPCHWCSTWECIEACSSEGLSLPPSGQPNPIAKAVIHLEDCLVSQGILCDTCIVHCPTSVKAITRDGRFPKMNEEACTGCGLCSYYCPAKPQAISMKPLEP